MVCFDLFSTVWKSPGAVFHGMEKSFPQCGKNGPDFSTVWKKLPEIFHSMENFFPQCGKPTP
jgi:hypothetical protein